MAFDIEPLCGDGEYWSIDSPYSPISEFINTLTYSEVCNINDVIEGVVSPSPPSSPPPPKRPTTLHLTLTSPGTIPLPSPTTPLTPHSPDTPTSHPCPATDCHKSYSNRRSLRRHWNDIHIQGKQRLFFCSICHKSFSTQRRQNTHQLSHLPRQELHKVTIYHEECPHCGKMFWDKTLFRRHLSVHSNIRPFACHLCGNQFKVKSSLTRHMKGFHPQDQGQQQQNTDPYLMTF